MPILSSQSLALDADPTPKSTSNRMTPKHHRSERSRACHSIPTKRRGRQDPSPSSPPFRETTKSCAVTVRLSVAQARVQRHIPCQPSISPFWHIIPLFGATSRHAAPRRRETAQARLTFSPLGGAVKPAAPCPLAPLGKGPLSIFAEGLCVGGGAGLDREWGELKEVEKGTRRLEKAQSHDDVSPHCASSAMRRVVERRLVRDPLPHPYLAPCIWRKHSHRIIVMAMYALSKRRARAIKTRASSAVLFPVFWNEGRKNGFSAFERFPPSFAVWEPGISLRRRLVNNTSPMLPDGFSPSADLCSVVCSAIRPVAGLVGNGLICL
jgi:hypothetical protein